MIADLDRALHAASSTPLVDYGPQQAELARRRSELVTRSKAMAEVHQPWGLSATKIIGELPGFTDAVRSDNRRKTISKRMRAKLAEVKDQLRRRMHLPIPEQGRWLASVVRGHLAYYAVPGNTDAVSGFRIQVARLWFKALRRRSQRHRLNWVRMNRIVTRWLPPARVQHPFPSVRFNARTQGRSPVR